MRCIWSALVLYVFINATTPVVVCVMIREWQLLVAWPNHFFISLFLLLNISFSGPSQVFILIFSLSMCGWGFFLILFIFFFFVVLFVSPVLPGCWFITAFLSETDNKVPARSSHTASDVSFRLTLFWRNSEQRWHISFVISFHHRDSIFYLLYYIYNFSWFCRKFHVWAINYSLVLLIQCNLDLKYVSNVIGSAAT